jgi:3-dehydroquinate synthase
MAKPDIRLNGGATQRHHAKNLVSKDGHDAAIGVSLCSQYSRWTLDQGHYGHDQWVVASASHDYPIHIGSYLLSDAELLRRYVADQQVLIVTNETLAPLYLSRIKEAFSSMQCDEVVLLDGESHKNQNSLSAIYDALITLHHHRDTTLIALGGGVIGDITGFAAATYQRGVRYIQVPTTLLAQVDASVGGKTAINHPQGKNMIGSFHQPHAVLMDVSTLATLPEREFRSGLAEVIKYGGLVGGDFLSQLSQLLAEGVLVAQSAHITSLIAHCCKIKAYFVHGDEKETGHRALLNLGHTFAHALETYTHYERWLHGEAVAIGLYCALLLSHQWGVLDESYLGLFDGLLQDANLPRRIPKGFDIKVLQSLMMKDKKIKNKTLRFVLMRKPGDCYLESQVTEDVLFRVLMSAVEGGEE